MSKTILLAVDLNDPQGAERPAEEALELAKAMGAKLHVMNVVPDFGMAVVGSFFTKDHNRQMLDEARSALLEWSQERFGELDGVSFSIDQGTVYEQIIKEASQLGVDLIVVGAHKSQLKDYLIGPNAARIARHAKQSVLVVRD
ncbi:universal stress protein [Kiloniella sp. b19]|uniref:universal stress protein n=1 Tax=Kiloniella sp. GXU_MW_B19 TaxID=3141326 RepID=UPI0031DB85DF